jgi:hypothetical protein
MPIMFHRSAQLPERKSGRKGARRSRKEAERLPIDRLRQAGIVETDDEFVRARLREGTARIDDREAGVVGMIDEGLARMATW